MSNIPSKSSISDFVEEQFPAFYQEGGENLILFTQAYYEFLEQNNYDPLKLSRDRFDHFDVDKTLDEFVFHFKNTYLNDFPFISATDKRFMIKHILDYYRSKGSKLSIELLLRMIYNVETEIYLPGEDILKADDSKWNTPKYIELTISPNTKNFLNNQITGSISGATAFAEGVVRKRIQGKLIDVLYLSNIKGTFQTDELIYTSQYKTDVPKIIGSLSSVSISIGGRNNAIGDLLNVTHESGKQGIVRVTSIEDATGRVDFEISDGGFGYTLNTPYDGDDTNDYTDIRVASAMIQLDNSNTSNQFIHFENVRQIKEQINGISASEFNSSYFANTSNVAGDYAVGVKTYVEQTTANGTQTIFNRDGSGSEVFVTEDDVLVDDGDYSSNSTTITYSSAPSNGVIVKVVDYDVIANGQIISVANTDGANVTITNASANTRLIVNPTLGTYGNQISINFTTSDAPFSSGETIYEEQFITIGISSLTGTFNVGETVEMKVNSAASNVGNTVYVENYAFGEVVTSNSTVLTLNSAFGTFETSENLFGITSGANATISSVSVDTAGASGILTSNSDANTWIAQNINGEFTVNNKVRGNKTRVIEIISSIANTGVSDIWYNGNSQANLVSDTYANVSVSGIVIGQNTTWVGLFGNTGSFDFIANADLKITTSRAELKEHDISSAPDLNLEIISIGTGENATFETGSLENEETVTLNTDLIGSNNTANVEFLDVVLDGSNSGYGFVDSITITDGGTSYSNDAVVTFSGGGFADGNPLIEANGSITTDGSGTITAITINTVGEGYFSTPTINLPATGGDVATVVVNMDFGYGFSKNPSGDSTTEFQNLWTNDNFALGSISSLTRINPGNNYNVDPFINLNNKYIVSFNRRDFILSVDITTGSFKIGENILQNGQVIGTVTEANTSIVKVKRASFNQTFDLAYSLIGAESEAQADLLGFSENSETNVMGNNAIIAGDVITANGVATAVEIIDSGYGYVNGIELTLESANNPFVMTATSNVATQGVGTGYWSTFNSQIDSNSKVHDNKYYQEYSYDVITGVSIDKYKDILKNILHVAGTKMFGTVTRNTLINTNTKVANTGDSTVSVV